MPRQTNPSDLPGVAKAPEARLPSSHKTLLRTYSRRSLKRRHTSPPAQTVERFLTRTRSLSVTEQKTTEHRNAAKNQQPSRSIPNKDRKRLRFSLASAENKTPSDLAWEALASSAPVLTREDDGSSDEGGSHETHVVECSPGHKGSVHQQPAAGDVVKGPTKSGERRPRGDAASEVDALENMSLEESDEVEDDSSEPGQDGEADITALTSSSEGDGTSIPTNAESQKPKTRGRFLIFDRSPPKGFKVLHKPRVNPETKPPITKNRQKLTDGFTEDEARPLFLGKRRRLQQLDINVGSLDLTQTGKASQQRQREISPEVKRQTQTRTTAGLWRGRQYFGSSQFKIESQDPDESSEVKEATTKGHKIDLDRYGRPIRLVDNFGPIVIPRTDSPRPENSGKMDSSSEPPGEVVQDSSPSIQPFPKRSMNCETGKSNSLTLRPGPPSRLKSDFVITDTPLQRGDASR
ncbi:hypothetical protein INS49_001043 [Diaporthe citri]|uniref:uncharacterized protein n=1 Tax=Diaporthe citri TaxID=83186 RepID=UPI001C8061AD|nr:uncharacterized protein INS49_001043 [Diaporthe citri]KAG6366862.1 hypothetical protein INS49_001043 [Diaporthe citri]